MNRASLANAQRRELVIAHPPHPPHHDGANTNAWLGKSAASRAITDAGRDRSSLIVLEASMERLKLAIGGVSLLGLLLGCGGTTDRNQDGGGANSTAGVGGAPDRNDGGGGATHAAGAAGTTSGTTAGDAPAAMTLDSFDTSDTFVSIGLWMEFPDNKLPIGTPPRPHDGSAMHLVGTTDDNGLDVFFHTGVPVEKIWSGVRFWAQSDAPDSSLTVAVAGPEPSYFKDRAQGLTWPQRVVAPTHDWQEVAVSFADLGVDPQHLSPHSGPYGAFHFIIEPNTPYDLWLDDFVGLPLYP